MDYSTIIEIVQVIATAVVGVLVVISKRGKNENK